MIVFANEVFTNAATDNSATGDVRQPQALSHKERRLERLHSWRVANREYLREYLLRWKAAHPDRVKVHREREYAERRRRRRRLRLRREAQRQRRALQRSIIRQTAF